MSTASSFDRFCLRLGRTTAMFAIVVLALLGIEMAARQLHQPEPLRRVYDPFSYRIPQPDLVDRFETPDGVEMTVRLNELGMRGPSLATPSLTADQPLTLVFLGGSTTENYSTPREQTFPELIGEHLRRTGERPVRVFNAGMSSATTGVSLARLQHQVLDLEPSLIVVKHAINDLLFGFLPTFRPDGRHLPRPAQIGRLPRSYLLDWLRHRRLSGSIATDPSTRALGPRRQLTDYSNFPALRVFERNLRSMAAIASSRGIPILFLTQASRYRAVPEADDEQRFVMASRVLGSHTVPPDIASLALGMKVFNSTVLGLAQVPGVEVFDLAKSLPANDQSMSDECHLTSSGNQLVARALAPAIEQLLVDSTPADNGQNTRDQL